MGESTTLTIRLEPEASPISGVVVAGGEEESFTGWIELATLIEAVHRTAPGTDPVPNEAPGSSPTPPAAARGS